ncbi:MAG: NADH-quinone oxidoreductase subunit J [Phycisphaerae bacterium]
MTEFIEAFSFYIMAGLAVGGAIGVVVSTNIVRTAVFLLGALGAVAGLYFLLGANFLAVVQLIVYAGGTLILIIFGVMLTSKSPWIRFNPTRGQVVVAGIVSTLTFVGLGVLLLGGRWSDGAELTASPKVAAIGHALLTDYLVPFEVASVLLLVVMIGAAYLARPEK